MFEQTSLFGVRSTDPIRNLLAAIDSGADNNTWILVSGGSSTGEISYRPGDEFENTNNAIVDLIHNGWFNNRTVFIAYKRELGRARDREADDPAMEGLDPEYRNRFAFYSVFKTLIRRISVQDLLDSVDEKEISLLAEMLRRRYSLSRKMKNCMLEGEEEDE